MKNKLKEIISSLIKNETKIIFFFILIVAIFIRTYKLDTLSDAEEFLKNI